MKIYEIFEKNKTAFHARWHDHATRIMAKYGFNVLGTWETKTGPRTEFVYLLEWPNEKTMLDSWTKFRADKEWQRIRAETNAKHGDLVGEIQDRTLINASNGLGISQPLRSD